MKSQNINEEQAYQLTQTWLLEHGKELCTTKLNIPYDIQTILNLSPATLIQAKKLIEQELQQQVEDVRLALRNTNTSNRNIVAPTTSSSSTTKSYRNFANANETERLSLRANSKEYQLPRGPGYESDEELKLTPSSNKSSSTTTASTSSTKPTKK